MKTVYLPGDDYVPPKPKNPIRKTAPQERPQVPEMSPMARTYRDLATELARASACESDGCVMPDEHDLHRSLTDILRDNRNLARLDDQWGKWWARLHSENDALWRRLNALERQSAEAGVRLDDDALVAHGAELQAIAVATEQGRDSLDQFRTIMVTAMFDVAEQRKAGHSDTDILNALVKILGRANDKAEPLGDLTKARGVVAQQRAEWQRVVTEKDWALFEAAS